jgi:high-affinity nickel permease
MLITATACLLGFANGMRHALEPDHLAAVSTLVAGERSAKTSVRFAAAWGAGHASTLVIAAGALALLRTELPDLASDGLELVVAVVLIALGVRGLVHHRHRHRHRHQHRHLHDEHGVHAPDAVHDVRAGNRWTVARLPFVVGLVHGLAGSGALAALVASHVASPAFSLGFIAIYAFGAAAGMATLAGVLGWPLARLARAPRLVPALVALSAAASVVVGVAWATPILLRLAA